MYAIVLLAAVILSPALNAEEPVPAAAWGKEAAVLFWQTNFVAGSQGTCGIDFFFDGANLKDSIENLTLKIHIIAGGGQDAGTEDVVLQSQLGGYGFQRYAKASLSSPDKWPNREDGVWSPLCDPRTSLIVESAVGEQKGKTVDLVRFHQLKFTSFQKIAVTIK